MNWNDLKKKLDKLSKEELQKEAIFITDCKTQSGVIDVAKKLPATLYNTFEDDPNELKTRKQLKEDGMDAEENDANRLLADGFTCQACKHHLPIEFNVRTEGFCYLCDPNITLEECLLERVPKAIS